MCYLKLTIWWCCWHHVSAYSLMNGTVWSIFQILGKRSEILGVVYYLWHHLWRVRISLELSGRCKAVVETTVQAVLSWCLIVVLHSEVVERSIQDAHRQRIRSRRTHNASIETIATETTSLIFRKHWAFRHVLGVNCPVPIGHKAVISAFVSQRGLIKMNKVSMPG